MFVVTGAAGSIVSAITADLAAASGGTFYLLDLTPEPDPRNSDLARLDTDKEGLKRDIFERLKAARRTRNPGHGRQGNRRARTLACGAGRHPGRAETPAGRRITTAWI